VRSAPGARLTWPHRNLPHFVHERQQRLRSLPHWDPANEIIFDAELEPYAQLVESLTAHTVLPVSIVGPLRVDLAQYHESGATRSTEDLYIPLAHSERALAASLQRGMTAITAAGTAIRTHVLKDRMTRDSCFLFTETSDAITFANWIATQLSAMQQWLTSARDVSRHAILREIDTHVLGPACHVLYRFTTGEACGPNMITRNAFALNTEFANRFASESGLRPSRVLIEANMGGDKKPSAQYFVDGGHGKTVLAEVTIPEPTLRTILRTTTRDLVALEHLGLHGSHASAMQSVAFTPASIVAALFAATGQDLGMVGTSSMAHDVLEPLPDDGGIHLAIRFAGLEVGTIGGGTAMPHARAFLSLLGCHGPGSALRLAQIVAAAALALELSAAASAATPFSANFVQAHASRASESPP